MTIHKTDNTGAGNTHLITVCYRLDELFVTHCNVLWLPCHLILSSEIMHPILLHSSHILSTTCCMLTIEHDPPITWRPHMALTLQPTLCLWLTDMIYNWHVAGGQTQSTWDHFDSFAESRAHSAFNVAVRLCACFVAAPTVLISVKFGRETFMDPYRGNANLVKTRQK